MSQKELHYVPSADTSFLMFAKERYIDCILPQNIDGAFDGKTFQVSVNFVGSFVMKTKFFVTEDKSTSVVIDGLVYKFRMELKNNILKLSATVSGGKTLKSRSDNFKEVLLNNHEQTWICLGLNDHRSVCCLSVRC